MPWNEVKAMDQKKDFIDSVLNDKLSFSESCRQFSISRKTGYKWVERYNVLGLEGLLENSRKPHRNSRELDESTICQILNLRYKRPSLGPRKIKARLEDAYPNGDWPSASSIGNLLDRYGLSKKRRKRIRVPVTAPLSHCNDVNEIWSADFKGAIRLENGIAIEPLTISDAHSRFLIQCIDLELKNTEHVWTMYERAFYEFGLPKKMRTDNGPPFGSCAAGRLTPLAINLVKAGIVPEWIRPGNPQENGRHERLHRSLEEVVSLPRAATRKEIQERFRDFVDFYNNERPHEALGQKVPSSVYSPSSRTWSGRLESPEYSSEFDVRRVSKGGQVKFKGKKVYIAENLTYEPVGVKEVSDGWWEVFYGPIYLGKIGSEDHLIKPQLPGRSKTKRAERIF